MIKKYNLYARLQRLQDAVQLKGMFAEHVVAQAVLWVMLLGGLLALPLAGKQTRVVAYSHFFFFSTPIFLKTHFSLKKYTFKSNYMFHNSVIFSIKSSIFFFPTVSLFEKAVAFFFFILYLGCKVVKCFSHSPN